MTADQYKWKSKITFLSFLRKKKINVLTKNKKENINIIKN